MKINSFISRDLFGSIRIGEWLPIVGSPVTEHLFFCFRDLNPFQSATIAKNLPIQQIGFSFIAVEIVDTSGFIRDD